MNRVVTMLIAFIMAYSMLIVAEAEEADVPSFRKIAGRNVTFTGQEGGSYAQTRTYGYDCSMDLNQNFAQQFMSLLIKSQKFTLTDHDFRDYRKYSESTGVNRTYENWYFTYTGYKKDVPKFSEPNLDHPGDNYLRYRAHLKVGVTKDYNVGKVHFSIKMSQRITYGGDADEGR